MIALQSVGAARPRVNIECPVLLLGPGVVVLERQRVPVRQPEVELGEQRTSIIGAGDRAKIIGKLQEGAATSRGPQTAISATAASTRSTFTGAAASRLHEVTDDVAADGDYQGDAGDPPWTDALHQRDAGRHTECDRLDVVRAVLLPEAHITS